MIIFASWEITFLEYFDHQNQILVEHSFSFLFLLLCSTSQLRHAAERGEGVCKPSAAFIEKKEGKQGLLPPMHGQRKATGEGSFSSALLYFPVSSSSAGCGGGCCGSHRNFKCNLSQPRKRSDSILISPFRRCLKGNSYSRNHFRNDA